ncbi:MAG: hypothetical protein ACOCT9_02160 [archaeon]
MDKKEAKDLAKRIGLFECPNQNTLDHDFHGESFKFKEVENGYEIICEACGCEMYIKEETLNDIKNKLNENINIKYDNEKGTVLITAPSPAENIVVSFEIN